MINGANYYKFVAGGEFLFFIDGSQENVIITTNIVRVNEYNQYKLIMGNYNNQTVEVNIMYEVRIYGTISEENSSEISILSNLDYILIIIIIILTPIVIFFFITIRKQKQNISKTKEMLTSKKIKYNKEKKIREKSKKLPENKTHKKQKNRLSKKYNKASDATLIKVNKNAKESKEFCGFCGEPVDTPYCKKCGHKV